MPLTFNLRHSTKQGGSTAQRAIFTITGLTPTAFVYIQIGWFFNFR